MKKRLFLLALAGLFSVGVSAQRVTDKLDRGVVAVPAGEGNLVSWRKFGSEYYDTKYNLYRDGALVASDLVVSNYKDRAGTVASTYAVEAVVRGVKQAKSAAVKAWANTWFDVPVQPVVNRAGQTIGNSRTDGASTTSGYTINDVTLADVDGDGVAEFIVKRNNSKGNLRSAANKTDFNLYECYKTTGERLWWIDLGPNLMAGADEQWDLIGYDWDQDGKAECIMRGADNMIIHTASGKTINIGNMQAGFNGADRPEYMGVGKEYLLYLCGETGEPYGWDGAENWTPMAYPLPQFEANETAGDANVWGDLGHRMMKHYFGAPYLDGVHPSIFLGRGCYTRHKFCALDVNPTTHELTQRWRWNCYDSRSPWFGNGFHNFQIADVDMDGRDEIMFGSMCIDDTGFGLSTTGLGHGDAQHCGDLDPYRWGLEQFNCLEGSEGNSYWNPTTGEIYYRKSDGGDDGRALAGNFSNDYPGCEGRSVSSGVIGLSSDRIINTNGDAMSGTYSNLNNRIFWDGDLLDEILNSAGGEGRPAAIFKWGGSRIWSSEGAVHNNSSKCNPSAQGDILGDWREEVVLRTSDNSAMRIFCTTYTTDYPLYTLWHDHEYRNAMCWQNVGYNQPPHPSFFLGELEGITMAPPPLMLEGRTVVSGTIRTTDEHLLVTGYENKTIAVENGASPYIITVNAPAWVKGTGAKQAVASTPKAPARTVETYTTILTGGAFSGATRLVKQGEGILVLPSVVEKHTGETNVWNGTLVFNGTMEQSPVWMNRHTTLESDGGQFMGGLKADYNATIYPGRNKVSSLTASTLTLGFGSRTVFDVSGGAIDQVNAQRLVIETKDWSFGPKYKTPIFEFVGAASLETGRYQIGTVANVEGSVKDILVEGISGKRFELELADGKLYLILDEMRESGNIIWNGTAENSIWDLAVTENFVDQTGQSTSNAQGDDVFFDDNAASTVVNVKGAVSPNSITFNNETKAYTLQGDSILGMPTLTKNGAGRLTITNENRLGATTINGGTVSVNALANLTGVTYGALGNVNQKITLNDGATLSVSQPVITDQQINVSGNVGLDVPTNMSFTLNKGLKGQGAVVTKSGAGTLTLGPSNTFSTLIIKAGGVNAVASGHVDQLPTDVEFQGGTLTAANDENTNIDNTANFYVPLNKTGTFRGAYRSTYRGALSGSGTFNVYTGGIRCYFDGDWSAFTGTINAMKDNRQNKKAYDPIWAFRNTRGLPEATLSIASEVRVSNEGKDIELGRVTGNGYLVGSGRWILVSDANYYLTTGIGVAEAYSVKISSSTTTTVGKEVANLVKRGEGKMTISKLGNINATMTVEDGSVTFNDSKLETLVCGTNLFTVKNKGRMVGQGKLNRLTLETGGKLIPCGSTFNETTPGTIKTTGLLDAKQGSTVEFVINSTKNSALECDNLKMNGTLRLTLASNYKPKSGDEFTLWTAAIYSGTPSAYELPELPAGLYWDYSGLAQKTGVIRISGQETDGIGRLADDTFVSAEVYSVGGLRLGSFSCLRGEIRQAVRQLGVAPGLYIVKMRADRNMDSETVLIR